METSIFRQFPLIILFSSEFECFDKLYYSMSCHDIVLTIFPTLIQADDSVLFDAVEINKVLF